MDEVARPCVMLRRSVTYPNIEASGTIARTTCVPLRLSMPSIWPRRLLRSPMTSPMNSSGMTTSTRMTGSRIVGSACSTASLSAIEPAILNAISDESTSWKEPSKSVALTSTIG